LVFLSAKSGEGFGLFAAAEAFAGDLGFAGGEDCDSFLVLLEFVALDFHVQDCSLRWLLVMGSLYVGEVVSYLS